MKCNLAIYTLLCAILIACTKESFSPAELIHYISDPENNLTQSTVVDDLTAKVTYRPTDLLVHQEIGGDIVSQMKLDSVRRRYGAYYYFVLSLDRLGSEALTPANTGAMYGEMVQVLSFRMNEYVKLTTSRQDTIPVGDFVLNRTFGFGSSTDILFVFSKEKSRGEEWVQFNLNEFGLGLGNQRFRFRVEDLENAPRISFNVSGG